jgi:hypothetical protein
LIEVDWPWYSITEVIEQLGQGYFEPLDLIVLRFIDPSTGNYFSISGVEAFAFLWEEFTTKGSAILYYEMKSYNNFAENVKGYSPPPSFLYNKNESKPDEGYFVWDLSEDTLPSVGIPAPTPVRPLPIPKKPKTVDELVGGLDEETLREVIKQSQERLKDISKTKKGRKK